MSENKNTLAKGMFVKEHTFKTGTKILNVSINVADFCEFAENNMNTDTKGTKWINLKFIPRKEITEKGISHTVILNDFAPKNADEALELLASKVAVSAEERAIVETPTKKTRKKASKKVKTNADDLPF